MRDFSGSEYSELTIFPPRPFPKVKTSSPRMPRGSPGMEGPNPVRYRVLAFDSDANVTTFATHGP